MSGFLHYRMKQIRRISITKEGFEKLKEKLEELEKSRPEAVNTLSEARKMGDLSENGLYTAAKARLRSIDSQIFRIKTHIKLAEVIEERKTDEVVLGSKVKVSSNSDVKTFHIVGEYEADPSKNKISSNSPLGKSLLNKKPGEDVEVKTPSGKTVWKILKIL